MIGKGAVNHHLSSAQSLRENAMDLGADQRTRKLPEKDK